ncbi:MAG TPA: single-stranded DNA-binding protein [Amycolatopsis sp.]|jgi:single-strand DNA-binding protein|nr:single-stranded DNA-binding protein [Amycolatopsis sp.]
MTIGETPVTVLGTVISEVTLKRVGEHGHELTAFLVRANERKFDKQRGEWQDHRHFSIRVKCWRKLAVTAQAVLRRGDPVIVTGRLFVAEFETSEGQSRLVPEVEAWAVGPNLMLCTATVERAEHAEPAGGGPPGWHSRGGDPRNSQVEVGEVMPVGG